MGRITVLIATLLTGAALADSATAASNPTRVPELAGGPLVLGKLGPFSGYRMQVAAAARPGHSVAAVEFVRTVRGVTQTTAYTFTLAPGALRIGRRLDTATLDTGTGLGRFGRVAMRFTRHGRIGALTGVLDFDTPLGRVRTRSLPAVLAVRKLSNQGSGTGFLTGPTSSSPNCGQYPHAAVLAVGPVTNTATSRFRLATLVAARPRTGPLALLAAFVGRAGPATEAVALEGAVPRSTLVLHGLGTARFDASGIPFMHGAVSFTRSAPLAGCPRRAAVGAASGSLRARLDFFGAVPLLTATRRGGAILIGPA